MPDLHTKFLIVSTPTIQGSVADLGRMKEGDYIMAVNGVNIEGRTALDIIDQISDDPNSSFVTVTVGTAASGTNGDAPSSSTDYVVRDVTMRRGF